MPTRFPEEPTAPEVEVPQVCPKYQGALEGDNVKEESVKKFRVSKVDVAHT
jgi:hypothetical protein